MHRTATWTARTRPASSVQPQQPDLRSLRRLPGQLGLDVRRKRHVQWKSGPFDLESELRWVFGTIDVDAPGRSDIDREGISFYLMETPWAPSTAASSLPGLPATIPPRRTSGKPASLGQARDPLLMFGNYWFTKYNGAMGRQIGPNEANLMQGFFKPFVGWKVNPQLEVVVQYAWLKADEKPTGYVDDYYGSELDIYANYKLYNNLTYTVGFGDSMTGDYFKGTNAAASRTKLPRHERPELRVLSFRFRVARS